MQKLRILQVIPDLRKGGAERLVIDICNELSKRGIEVLLLNFRNENHYEFLTKNIPRKTIASRYIPSIAKKATSDLNAYKAFVENYHPTVIHSHLYEAEMVTRQVLIPNVKYITHLHCNTEQLTRFSLNTLAYKRRFTNYFERRLLIKQYRKCRNRFIAVSRSTAQFHYKALPFDLRNIKIIHNAIDYNRFFKVTKNNLESSPVRLITVGSLVNNKNQIFLLNVVKYLINDGVTVHLDIIGEGPNRGKIEEEIKVLNLENYIYMHGNVDRVEEYLHRAHIYVHSAIEESFGLVILEAMASGLPFVMLDAIGNRDIADENRNGFLIKERSIVPFAEAIKKMTKDKWAYVEMSEYSKEFARQFDISLYADKLLEFYSESV